MTRRTRLQGLEAGGAALQAELFVDGQDGVAHHVRLDDERDIVLRRALRDGDNVDAAPDERAEGASGDAWRAAHHSASVQMTTSESSGAALRMVAE